MYRLSQQGWLKHIDFILLDMLCAQAAFAFAYSIRHGFDVFVYSVDIYRRMAAWIAMFGFVILVLFNTMHDVLKRGWKAELRKTAIQCVAVFATAIIYSFSVHEAGEYSRITIWVFLGIYFVLDLSTRTVWKIWLHRSGREKRSMLLVAEEKYVPEIIQKIISHPYEGIYLCGLILTNRDATGEKIEGVSVVSDLEGAAEYMLQRWIDEVFFVLGKLDEIPAD